MTGEIQYLDVLNEGPEITTSKEPRPDNPVTRSAQEFVKLVQAGSTLQEAEDATGLAETNAAVKKRLLQLGIYAKLSKETFRPVSEARQMEIVLHGEDRDSIAAHKVLYPEADAPLIEIRLTPEIAKMDVTLPGFPVEKEGENLCKK